jgi:hypothetical protein
VAPGQHDPGRTISHVTHAREHAETIKRVRSNSPQLRADILSALEKISWYKELDADTRSWIGMVVDGGIARLCDSLADPTDSASPGRSFDAVPFDAARAVTLAQTVELIRTTLDVGINSVPKLAEPQERAWLTSEFERFGRELAFGTATVYARAAEERGSWDGRLEAHIIDLMLAGGNEASLTSTAMAISWPVNRGLVVFAGEVGLRAESVARSIKARGRGESEDLIAVVHGMVVIVLRAHAAGNSTKVAEPPAELTSRSKVVICASAPNLVEGAIALQAVMAGISALPATPELRGLVPADQLLVERLMLNDPLAKRQLINGIYHELLESGPDAVATAEAMIATGGSLAAAARRVPVHISTLRYRLDRIQQQTGCDLREPAALHAARLALALGRLDCAPTASYEP